MAIHDPIAIYTAGSNLEAYCVREMLNAEGIEAAVVEDESRAGVWMFGFLPQFNKPQVWIERADAERARPLLATYEQRLVEREEQAGDGSPIAVTCDECRRMTLFPALKLGRVEVCPNCGAYVDVGDDPGFEGWDVAPGEDSA